MAAPTRLQATPVAKATSANSVVITFTTPPTIGSAILIPFAYRSGTTAFLVPTILDNQGNEYILDVFRKENDSTTGTGIFRCRQIAATGSPFTITLTIPSLSRWTACAFEMGHDGSGLALDGASSGTNNALQSTAVANAGDTPPLRVDSEFLLAVCGLYWLSGSAALIAQDALGPGWVAEWEELGEATGAGGECIYRTLSGMSGSRQTASWFINTGPTVWIVWKTVLGAYVNYSDLPAYEQVGGRVTSVAVETLTAPEAAIPRVTQVVIENLIQPPANAYVTQATIEVLTQQTIVLEAKVSQVGVELLIDTPSLSAMARVTQVWLEILKGYPPVLVTQVVAETLRQRDLITTVRVTQAGVNLVVQLEPPIPPPISSATQVAVETLTQTVFVPPPEYITPDKAIVIPVEGGDVAIPDVINSPGPQHEVWVSYTPDEQGMGFSFFASTTDTDVGYLPAVIIYTGPPDAIDLDALTHVKGNVYGPWQALPTTPGTTYYFRITDGNFGDHGGTYPLTVSIIAPPTAPIVPGTVFINDDVSGRPTTAYDGITGEPLGLLDPPPPGETGVFMVNGYSIWGTYNDSRMVVLLDPALNVVAEIDVGQSQTEIGTNRTSLFYVGALVDYEWRLRTIDIFGNFGPTYWDIPNFSYAPQPSRDDRILYYVTEDGIAIGRFDLVTHTLLSDLAPGVPGFGTMGTFGQEILVLPDNTILVPYLRSTDDYGLVLRYSPNGDVLTSYTFGPGLELNRITHDHNDGMAFWAWCFDYSDRLKPNHIFYCDCLAGTPGMPTIPAPTMARLSPRRRVVAEPYRAPGMTRSEEVILMKMEQVAPHSLRAHKERARSVSPREVPIPPFVVRHFRVGMFEGGESDEWPFDDDGNPIPIEEMPRFGNASSCIMLVYPAPQDVECCQDDYALWQDAFDDPDLVQDYAAAQNLTISTFGLAATGPYAMLSKGVGPYSNAFSVEITHKFDGPFFNGLQEFIEIHNVLYDNQQATTTVRISSDENELVMLFYPSLVERRTMGAFASDVWQIIRVFGALSTYDEEAEAWNNDGWLSVSVDGIVVDTIANTFLYSPNNQFNAYRQGSWNHVRIFPRGTLGCLYIGNGNFCGETAPPPTECPPGRPLPGQSGGNIGPDPTEPYEDPDMLLGEGGGPSMTCRSGGELPVSPDPPAHETWS